MLTEAKTLSVLEHKEASRRRRLRLAIALLCVGLSALATLPFFFMGEFYDGSHTPLLRMPITHDMPLQLEQMKSFYNGLRSGEIYPRWEEDTNRGYGAPTTSYYPPGVYYLTSACYFVAGEWLRAIMGAHLLMMIASAAALYFYARRTMDRGAAALAMSVYIVLPYHLIDQYHRGAVAELMGFIWMPLIMMMGERLIEGFSGNELSNETANLSSGRPVIRRAAKSSRLLLSLTGLAGTYSAFVWSHTPTAYQFTLAFGVFALVYALVRKRIKRLTTVAFAMALGLAMSAYYLYSAAVEQDLIRHEYVEENWPYHDSYVFVYAEPYATHHRGFFNLIDGTWTFNAILMIVAALALLIFRPRLLRMTEGLRERVISWTAIGCLASFLMTNLSYPFGRWIPRIDIGVFSWRMLSITSLVLALMAGACAQAALNAVREQQNEQIEKKNLPLVFRSLALFILIGGMIFSAAAVVIPKSRNPVFVPSDEHINLATIPTTAPREIEDLIQGERAATEKGEGRISVERWDTEHRALRVELNEADRLSIRTFNFPGWTANVNGHPAEIITGPKNGEIVLELAAGDNLVKLDYLDTTPRRTGRNITMISFLLFITILAVGFITRSLKVTDGFREYSE